MKLRKSWVTLSLILGTVFCSVAQDYYDDDIYYNADKAKKEKAEKAKKAAQAKQKANTPLPGSDQYVVFSDNSRDVDEYNRRYENSDAAAVNPSDDVQDFEYTRRIERFYNPEIVSGSDNEDLQYNYYESQADNQSSQVNINLYVTDPYYDFWRPWYYSTWRSPWYYSGWGWGWPSYAYGPG